MCTAAQIKEWRKRNPGYWKKQCGEPGSEKRAKFQIQKRRSKHKEKKNYIQFLKVLFDRIRHASKRRSKKRSYPVTIELEYLLSLWNKQEGKCALLICQC